MDNPKTVELRQKILKGIELSFERLIKKTQKNNGEFVFLILIRTLARFASCLPSRTYIGYGTAVGSTNFSIKRLCCLALFFLWHFSGFTAGSQFIQGANPPQAVSGNIARVSSLVQVHAVVTGKTIQPGSNSENGLVLNRVFEKTSHPWCYKLTVTLQNNSAAAFIASAGDFVVLSLSPWEDQELPGGLKSSSDGHTDAGPVASVHGKVVSGITGTVEEINLFKSSAQKEWAGLQDRYFALLVLPGETGNPDGYLPFTQTTLKPGLSFKVPVSELRPGAESRWELLIFAGPKSKEALTSGPANLSSLLFSGMWSWMRWLCFGLLGLLSLIHHVVPNWGWAIIVLALIVRICLYPLAKKALLSQQKFVDAQKLMAPELTEIKKNYKGGDQSERILQLYKKYNVSPMAGLKPLMIVLIQLPILIALFQVLGAAYELRDAPFLWIGNLAEPDRLFAFGVNIPLLGQYFNILPFLMAIVTLLSFKLAPAPTAEKSGQLMQNLFLIGMTLMFFFLFYSFPSGMVLYWTFANVFHIAQQRIMVPKVKA